MEKFTRLEANAAPMRRENVDTDQIIPMRFLITATRDGLGKGMFADWRYRSDGSENPDFVLNRAPWRDAKILVAGDNFGCGSSREHAPWALADYGFRAIVAPSFANIFFDNSFKNGVLLVTLPEAKVNELMDALEAGKTKLTVDLVDKVIVTQDGKRYPFEVEPRRRDALLAGLDEIGATLEHEPAIAAFQTADRQRRPWIYR